VSQEVSLDEWTGLSPAAKQNLLQGNDIHVYDPEKKAIPFNEDALLTITESMAKVFTVHGEFQRRDEVA